MSDETRLRLLNDRPARRGRYVLYWMQASQRVVDNPALERAVQRADELGLPVLAVFGLDASYPEANLRHFAFLLEGLAVARRDLERRGVQLAVLRAPADEAALRLAGPAALVVCDRGYLRHQRAWRARVAAEAPCTVEQVEGDVVVPLEAASRTAPTEADRLHFADMATQVARRQTIRAPCANGPSSGPWAAATPRPSRSWKRPSRNRRTGPCSTLTRRPFPR